MEYAILECEPHMLDIIHQLVPAGVEVTDWHWNQARIRGEQRVIPAAVVRLHTTLSRSGKRRCKLVPA